MGGVVRGKENGKCSAELEFEGLNQKTCRGKDVLGLRLRDAGVAEVERVPDGKPLL
jgi:hypothetical protein